MMTMCSQKGQFRYVTHTYIYCYLLRRRFGRALVAGGKRLRAAPSFPNSQISSLQISPACIERPAEEVGYIPPSLNLFLRERLRPDSQAKLTAVADGWFKPQASFPISNEHRVYIVNIVYNAKIPF